MVAISLVLTNIIFAFSFLTWADWPRFRNIFRSPDSKYEAVLQRNDRIWTVKEKSTGRELYTFNDYYNDGIWFSSMTLVVSNDGRQVVAVNDFAPQDHRQNPEVLFFFRDGKLVKTQRLFDMVDTKFMSFSVSHFRWLYDANKLAINDSKLAVTTLQMNHVVFDASSGAVIKKDLHKIFGSGAIFVYGIVHSVGQNSYEIKVLCSIQGDSKKGSRLQFKSDKIRWKGGGFHEAVILLNGRLIESRGVIFNNCD